jgi:glutathione synthase/RimK-type ligase-like ATP-grasp enzyme
MLKVLQLVSTPDSHTLVVTKNDGNINKLNTILQGNNTLSLLVGSDFAQMKVVTLGGLEPKKIQLEDADVIINSICDPDTNKKGLKQASELLNNVSIPVINAPSLIGRTTREETYNLLHTIPGIKIPKTVRITPRYLSDIPKMLEKEGLTYPYIFRSAGDHGGAGMELINNEDELHKLESFAFDGRDFYAIEFVDFRSEDGHYRKARVMVVDGEAYVRHLIIADSWKVHAESRSVLMNDRAALRQEEESFVTNPPASIKTLCKEMHKILELDFFGMDCNIGPDGSLLIFEINTCMNTSFSARNKEAYETYKYLVASSSKIKAAFKALLSRRIGQS